MAHNIITIVQTIMCYMSRQLGPGSRVSGLFFRENLGPICLDSRIPPYEIDDDDDD